MDVIPKKILSYMFVSAQSDPQFNRSHSEYSFMVKSQLPTHTKKQAIFQIISNVKNAIHFSLKINALQQHIRKNLANTSCTCTSSLDICSEDPLNDEQLREIHHIKADV